MKALRIHFQKQDPERMRLGVLCLALKQTKAAPRFELERKHQKSRKMPINTNLRIQNKGIFEQVPYRSPTATGKVSSERVPNEEQVGRGVLGAEATSR